MLSHGAKKFRHLDMAACAKFESPNVIIGHASLMKGKHTFRTFILGFSYERASVVCVFKLRWPAQRLTRIRERAGLRYRLDFMSLAFSLSQS